MSSVDVIVPCYRYARFLRQCVTSVLDQEGPSVRVLILDDASPDETPEVANQLVEEDSRVSFVRHPDNRGHIKTYNEGIAWISGDYYLLLSADDYLLPGALARAASLLDHNPGVGFVFGSVLEGYEEGQSTIKRPFEYLGMETGRAVLQGIEFISKSRARNIVSTPTAVVRTALQRDCGGYREGLPHTGDMEMWFRLAARAEVGVVDEAQAVYRRHSANMSLAFMAESMLPDFRQRKSMLEVFFLENARYLPDWEVLYGEAIYDLSCQVVSVASALFNDGRMASSKDFEQYALSLSSDVRRSKAWRNLRVKRAIGPMLSRMAMMFSGRRWHPNR